MRITKVKIEQYRSIKNVEITFPKGKPVILFGPNNAGKSNILSAIEHVLGEGNPQVNGLDDSDYFCHDKDGKPEARISVTFDSPFPYAGKEYNTLSGKFCTPKNTSLYCGNEEDNESVKFTLSEDVHLPYQAYRLDAMRSIGTSFNYSSKETLLSKFSHMMYESLSDKDKEVLGKAFGEITSIFNNHPRYDEFSMIFEETIKNSVAGFSHTLDLNFDAYDPTTYSKIIRIQAKEIGGDKIERDFDEFGTGEQQILQIAFAKAYMQTFRNKEFLFLLEEPEAHLHPQAQKWLKDTIAKMCTEGIQVVISTHSPDFIDPEWLEGLVRVQNNNGLTEAKQLTAKDFSDYCIQVGANKNDFSPSNIIAKLSSLLTTGHLKGLFAKTVLLVEGQTEELALPVYFEKANFSLPAHGIEIVDCHGKELIPLIWRIYQAYDYKCYVLFDADGKAKNDKFFMQLLATSECVTDPCECVVGKDHAYFGDDIESYFCCSVPGYKDLVKKHGGSCENKSKRQKPLIAKIIAQEIDVVPEFIEKMVVALTDMSKS